MAGKVRLMRVRTVTYQYRGRRVKCRASDYLSVATLGLQRRTKSDPPSLSDYRAQRDTAGTAADEADHGLTSSTSTFDVSDPWIRNGAARSPTREGTGSRSN
jgi:hypothetical protein